MERFGESRAAESSMGKAIYKEDGLRYEERESLEGKERPSFFQRLSNCVNSRRGRFFILLANLPHLRLLGEEGRESYIKEFSDVAVAVENLTASFDSGKEFVAERRRNDIDGTFADAAIELRADERARREFSRRSLEVVAEELEKFSTEKTFSALAKATGIPEDDLLMQQRLHKITFYSNSELDNVDDDYYAQFPDGGIQTGSELKGASFDVDGHYVPAEYSSKKWGKEAAGLCDAKQGVIYINLTHLNLKGVANDTLAAEDERRIRDTVNDVIYHEFLHNFSPEVQRTEVERLLYEGVTDALSMRLRSDLGMLASLDSEMQSPGYSDGPLYAGEFLFELLGGTNNSSTWKTYVTGFSGFEKIIDGKYGEGKYREIIDGDFPAVSSEMIPEIDLARYSDTYQKYMHLVPLYRLSRLAEPSMRSEIYGGMAVDFPDGRTIHDLSFVEGEGLIVSLEKPRGEGSWLSGSGIVVYSQTEDGVGEAVFDFSGRSSIADIGGWGLSLMGYGKTPVMGAHGVFYPSLEAQERDFELSGGIRQGTMLHKF